MIETVISFLFSRVSLNFALWLLSCEIVLLYVFAVFLQFDSSVFFLVLSARFFISVNKIYYYYYTFVIVSKRLWHSASSHLQSRDDYNDPLRHSNVCDLTFLISRSLRDGSRAASPTVQLSLHKLIKPPRQRERLHATGLSICSSVCLSPHNSLIVNLTSNLLLRERLPSTYVLWVRPQSKLQDTIDTLTLERNTT